VTRDDEAEVEEEWGCLDVMYELWGDCGISFTPTQNPAPTTHDVEKLSERRTRARAQR